MDNTVRYEITLYVTRPVEYDRDTPLEDQVAWRVSIDAKRELEREVLQCLRRLDGDCDCEVTSVDVTIENEEPRDEAYERAAARYDGEDKDWR